MKSFMATADFQITEDRTQATYLFEHVQNLRKSYKMSLQTKSEHGLWSKASGKNECFIVNSEIQTPDEVLNSYTMGWRS